MINYSVRIIEQRFANVDRQDYRTNDKKLQLFFTQYFKDICPKNVHTIEAYKFVMRKSLIFNVLSIFYNNYANILCKI